MRLAVGGSAAFHFLARIRAEVFNVRPKARELPSIAEMEIENCFADTIHRHFVDLSQEWEIERKYFIRPV